MRMRVLSVLSKISVAIVRTYTATGELDDFNV